MSDEGAAPPEKSLTRYFFEDQVPRGIADNRAMLELMQGSICIVVQEEGAWTIRFGKYEPGFYTEEVDESADCVLVFERAGFEKVLRQEPTTPEDEPKMYGDEKMLRAFNRLLTEKKIGQLGIRSAKD